MNTPPASLTASLSGRYRIERELGQGGMATVYLAHDLNYDRPVAIKVLHPELAHTLGPERFTREISITAQLNHPHILSLLDSGVVEPQSTTHGSRLLFYVMPYVAGESLRDRLNRQTQLPIDEALKLFGEIADALDHAHGQGFVHRDLKPENILLQDGHARVADFGIARAMSAVGSEKLTQTGLALGTPSYMSPEQAAGQNNIDARSDIYALGCLLYEMLAGNPPFQGPTSQAIMARHAVDPVPALRTVRGTVPASVEAAITKALAKVPADRFTSAAEFVEAFSKPVPALRTAGVRSRATTLLASAAIALVLAAGIWLFARSRRPQVEPNASVIAVLPFGTSGDTALVRLSHDLVLTVSASLDGVGGIRTADPQKVLSEADDSRSGQWLPNAIALGKRLGAGSVVVGSIVSQGKSVQLDLKLVSTTTKADSEPLARVSVTSSPDSITALTDSITWALLRQVWRRGDPPSPSYANLTTRSVVALRAFLDGERLSAAGDWSAAANAYAAAIEADSSLWVAGWGYNNTQGWLLDGTGEEVLTRGYQSHLSSFGARDRLLIEADIGADTIMEVDYLARLQSITRRFPQDWPVWYKYADALFHIGPTVGYTNDDVRAALRRTVDLNPKLVPMWEHLFLATVGRDSVQAVLAEKSLAALGLYARRSAERGYDASLPNRVALAATGQVSAATLDSLASAVTGEKDFFRRLVGNFNLLMAGLPQAQLELSRRLLARDPRGPFAGFAWYAMADAWAARGAWDSALVAGDHMTTVMPEAALGYYQKLVSGAWLGGLDTAQAGRQRAAAVKYLASLPPDSASTKDAQARLAWADGILAVLRQDRRALAEARAHIQRGGAATARFLDRSLAGFELELSGAKRAAAESLAALDLAATDAELWADGPRDPFARSINHLAASELLLEQGDTSRAVKVLAWHEAWPPASPDPGEFQLFSALAYYELARIEDAQGRTEQAREHYEQFLRRYDMPMPAHQHLVNDANAALRRLAGQRDPPGEPMNALDRLATALAARYRVERELGHGGMATVYLAHDLKHDRPVAIKVLHPELAHALGPERFLREITITAQFDHPYILSLLDSGVVEPRSDDGRRLLYYVMPYVVGESLRDRMKREKQLPLDDALQVTREVAEALGYAHARGVIHRDIKPENILLSGGHARVADFGIARAIDAAGSASLTETGLAIGTPAYMSPEQSMAEREIDGRSDLYALGSVLYEMLAGEPPYTGPTAQAIIAKRMTNPVPSVRTLRETVPESVDRALASVLARSPADRFATAAQFEEALSQRTSFPPAAAGSRDARKTAWIAGAGIALVLSLLGGWLFARSRRSPIAPSASVIAVLPFLPSTADTALARLGRDLVITISANLDGVGGIQTADPRLVLAGAGDSKGGRGTADAVALGKDLGAGSVVVGDLVRVGPDVRLDLKLLTTSGDAQPLARASITSALDSIGTLTDSVTWALLRQVWRRGEPPSPSYASLTTRSVPALRAFLEGEQHFVAGRWPEAIEAYASAIKADSSFWLAGWRYNSSQAWLLHGNKNDDLKRGYESHLSAFGERDRLLIELERDGGSLTEEEFLARSRAIVNRFPDDWAVWWMYADEVSHWGPLIGVTNAEGRAALQRTVDLNPKLVPMWGHLFDASIGHDSAQAALALKALTALGGSGDGDRYGRLLLSAGGPLPGPLRDSVALDITGSTDWIARAIFSGGLQTHGYPAAQIELNRRLIELAPHDTLTHIVWENMANSWAARGAWDSTLVAFDHWAAADHRGAFDQGIHPLMYQVAISGAWLGGLDTARAAERRAAAVKYIRGLPPGSAEAQRPEGRLAWADGVLAVLRRDLHGLAEARSRLRQSGGTGNEFRERSLAGLELELRGAKKAAAESLAALDLAAPGIRTQDPYARSISHLAASRLLLEQGDTTRALKLLVWHEAAVPASPEPFRSPIFAGLAYYYLAGIEEAQGRTDLARDHYQQFLRRYDMPPVAHQYLVDEAKAALQRLASEDRASRK